MNDRNLWVDYAKAIGILLVVYGHVVRGLIGAGIIEAHLPRWLLVDSVLYSFHMPLFFFLSGLFFWRSLGNRGGSGLVFNKIDTIFYPFVLWSLLQGGIEVALSRYTNGDLGMAKVLSLLWDPRAQFWFLWALFFSFLLAVLLIRRETLQVPVFFAAVALYLVEGAGVWMDSFKFVAENLVFFIAGILFSRVRHLAERHTGLLAFAGSLAFVLLAYIFHAVLGLTYDDRGLASLLLAFAGILMTAGLCMLLARRSIGWLLALGALSMPIYLMHILAGSGARVVLGRVFGSEDPALHVVVGCLVGVLAPVVVARLLQALDIRWFYEAPEWLSIERWRRRRLDTIAGPVA